MTTPILPSRTYRSVKEIVPKSRTDDIDVYRRATLRCLELPSGLRPRLYVASVIPGTTLHVRNKQRENVKLCD